MRIISTTDEEFPKFFKKLETRNLEIESRLESRVRKIINEVREKGDRALIEYTRKFDGWNPKKPEDLVLSEKEIEKAEKYVDKEKRKAIEKAFERILKYHKKTFPKKLVFREKGGRIERVFVPLDAVGIYSPGGKAAYPSTVLMTAVPALVAGVKEIYLATPAPQNTLNPYVVFAAKIAGVKKIFKIGGAQAIAAFAYGTETVPQVEKIAGPGNIYVALAKELVRRSVGIDLIAGPSEIVTVCDGSVHPILAALDLVAQAEHDERAMCVAICHIEPYLHQVKNAMLYIAKLMPRREIILEAFRNFSALIVTRSLSESIELVNKLAPEHVEVLTKSPDKVAKKIRKAGTIFVGPNSPQAIGDYVAGPSHVLPTGGTAKFFSGLSVLDFLRATNIIFFTKRRMIELAPHAIVLARIEGLLAHAYSLEKRLNGYEDIREQIKNW